VIVEVPSGNIVRTIPTGTSRATVSFRPDGKLLAIGTNVAAVEGRVTRVELMDPASGRIVHHLSGELATLGRLVFSPDGRRLAASLDTRWDNNRGRILIWDMTQGARRDPVRIDRSLVDVLAFSPDGGRLATGAHDQTFTKGEVQLWDTSTGRDLATWSIASGVPRDLAFDLEGRQLRMASYKFFRREVSVTRFDASPLAPEIEAVDLVNRLGPDVPLNIELAAKIESEPGLGSGVRAAALTMAAERFESFSDLRTQASRWLELAPLERTPELMRRALAHIEQAMRLTDNADFESLRVQAEARYRNGQFSAALEPLRKAQSQRDGTAKKDPGQQAKIQALIAMAEARLGHRTEAQAALARYRLLWAEANPKASTPSLLTIEVEQTVSEAFQTTEKGR
jgi:hypothetical protein